MRTKFRKQLTRKSVSKSTNYPSIEKPRALQNKKLIFRSGQKIIFMAVMLILFYCISACKLKNYTFTTPIPVGGNSWLTNTIEDTSAIIGKNSISNWSSGKDTLNTYFHTDKTGELKIGIRAKVNSGKSKINISFGSKSKILTLSNTEFDTIYIGKFRVTKPGYQCIKMHGINKSSDVYADVTALFIGGKATGGNTNYVRNDFYWGRRGPSVHLSYPVEEKVKDVKWFYNEITVPKGEDVLGSYFMANGFGQGYFGIQVNSSTERRILFSVWSPFKTDNPNEIPDEQKIVLLKKGEGVYTGEFGNEGSGGQSYLKYSWKAGNTYKFLLKGEPTENNSSIFTAYFYAPELGKWKLIASFKRPNTNTYLTRLHSFLENFYTETGEISRKAYYSNQWVCDSNGKWLELTKAKFTADATARKNARLDFAGGSTNEVFFLKNCGFFNENTAIDSFFERKESKHMPDIEFNTLP